MKITLSVIGLALVVHTSGILERLLAEPTPVAAAVAVKCDHLESDQRQECVGRFQEEFRSGELDPVAVLRLHCTRFDSQWTAERGDPPSTCVERFGGWVES